MGWLDSELGWAAKDLDEHQWMLIDLKEPQMIFGIVVQGRAQGPNYVNSLKVFTSLTAPKQRENEHG